MNAEALGEITLAILATVSALPWLGWMFSAQAHRREVVRNEQLRWQVDALKEEIRERDDGLRGRAERRRLSAAMMRASVVQRATWVPPMWMN